MREPKKIELDGAEFEVRPLASRKAATFWPRVLKVLGPPLAALAGAKGAVEASALKEAIGLLGERLDEKEADLWISTLLADCTFQPLDRTKPGGSLLKRLDTVDFDPATVYRLVAAALEVNYSGFLELARAAGLRLGVGDSTSPKP